MPKITNNPLNQVIPTRLNTRDYEDLLNSAKQQQVTITALLRKLVLEYLDKLRQQQTITFNK
ncbi:MAG: hypothetical protein U7127_20740 [Phormidium sp.]